MEGPLGIPDDVLTVLRAGKYQYYEDYEDYRQETIKVTSPVSATATHLSLC